MKGGGSLTRLRQTRIVASWLHLLLIVLLVTGKMMYVRKTSFLAVVTVMMTGERREAVGSVVGGEEGLEGGGALISVPWRALCIRAIDVVLLSMLCHTCCYVNARGE